MKRIALLPLLLVPAMAFSQYDTNLVANSGFETYTGLQNGLANFANWSESSAPAGPWANQYLSFPVVAGPSDRGTATNLTYALGGDEPFSSMWQNGLSVAFAAADIDAGSVKLNLSSFFGGSRAQEDYAIITATLRNASGTQVGSMQLGPATAAMRGGETTMVVLSNSAYLPSGVRFIDINIGFTRTEGLINNGCVDDVTASLSLEPVPEPASLAALAFGAAAIARRKRS